MKTRVAQLFVLVAAVNGGSLLLADDHGPDPRLTGAPGDQTCVACHLGTAVNAGGGSVKLSLPGGTTYTPGVKQRVTITITDSAAKRWGFELTARLGSNLSGGQAGSFTAPSTSVQVICETGRVAPCTNANVVQFAEHTLAGYRAATPTFEVDWTPPATDVGPVRLYVAGNGANGNGQNSGDHIYTSMVELTPAASGTKPTILSSRGVTNGASFTTTVAPQTWITIAGTNLATATRVWSGSDIVDGKLPTALDGVSVTVNGKAAYVQYISPTQINALSPADTATGPVEVKVTAGGVTSDASTVTLQAVAPALFSFDGTYAAAAHADGTFVGKTGLFASAPSLTTPAKPGETIILYGTGFGGTSPAAADGSITTGAAAIADSVRVTIGGTEATAVYAGLAPGFARLYQFNVTVPESAADGDLPVMITVGGTAAETTKVTVQR